MDYVRVAEARFTDGMSAEYSVIRGLPLFGTTTPLLDSLNVPISEL